MLSTAHRCAFVSCKGRDFLSHFPMSATAANKVSRLGNFPSAFNLSTSAAIQSVPYSAHFCSGRDFFPHLIERQFAHQLITKQYWHALHCHARNEKLYRECVAESMRMSVAHARGLT